MGILNELLKLSPLLDLPPRDELGVPAIPQHQPVALGESLDVVALDLRAKPGTAFDLGGPEALTTGSRLELLWRQSLWETIGGGTSEVMRGVVARQALGLGP